MPSPGASGTSGPREWTAQFLELSPGSSLRLYVSAKVLDIQKFVLPHCFPLQGTVQKCFDQYYANGSVSFPPPGLLLEVTYYDVREETIGSFERENLDVPFLAWLMLLKEIDRANDTSQFATFMKASQLITMKFNKRIDEKERLWAVYQLKEHEEKNADLLGHSILQRARELSALQAQRHEPAESVRDRTSVKKVPGTTRSPRHTAFPETHPKRFRACQFVRARRSWERGRGRALQRQWWIYSSRARQCGQTLSRS